MREIRPVFPRNRREHVLRRCRAPKGTCNERSAEVRRPGRPGPGLVAPAAHARDIWDLTGNDGSAATRSEIAPGALQVHDLEGVGGIADQDWFRVSQKPYSSYEVLVDGLTGGLAPVPVTVPGTELGVHLVRAGGSTVPSNALGASGSARVLYFRNETGTRDRRRIRPRLEPAMRGAPASRPSSTASGSSTRPTASRASTTPRPRSRSSSSRTRPTASSTSTRTSSTPRGRCRARTRRTSRRSARSCSTPAPCPASPGRADRSSSTTTAATAC